LPVAVPVNASSLKYAGMYRVGSKTPLAHLCFLHCNVHITEACIGHWLGAEWFPAISVASSGENCQLPGRHIWAGRMKEEHMIKSAGLVWVIVCDLLKFCAEIVKLAVEDTTHVTPNAVSD